MTPSASPVKPRITRPSESTRGRWFAAAIHDFQEPEEELRHLVRQRGADKRLRLGRVEHRPRRDASNAHAARPAPSDSKGISPTRSATAATSPYLHAEIRPSVYATTSMRPNSFGFGGHNASIVLGRFDG